MIRTGTMTSYLFACSISFNNILRTHDVIVKTTVIKYTVILTSLFKDNQLRILLPSILVLIFDQHNMEKMDKHNKTGRKQL